MQGIDKMLADIDMEVHYTREYIGKDALSPAVLKAMRKVPRQEFLPDDVKQLAYNNGPLPIGYGQTISQPYIVALMTDLLNPKKDFVVLEVGTGSGYQAAVLAELVKQVYTTEIIEELAVAAQRRLQRLNYSNVQVKLCDGYFGWAQHAPYDGIIVTAAASSVPSALIQQLKPNSRLVIPVGEPHRYQELIVIVKDEKEQLHTKTILGVAFVPLTGDHYSS